MLAIKFKNKTILYIMINFLLFAFIFEVISAVVEIHTEQKVSILVKINILMVALSFIVPYRLFYLWDRIKDSVWRETFDALTKANKYLKND
jgi:hypothetical protein